MIDSWRKIAQRRQCRERKGSGRKRRGLFRRTPSRFCPPVGNTTVSLTNTTHLLYTEVVKGQEFKRQAPAAGRPRLRPAMARGKAMKATARSYDYPLRLAADDNDTILVTFPDFPEAHTFGKTADEALVHAVDALACVVDAYIRDRRAIPRPSSGKITVPLPALMASKVALYELMREQHVGKAELARRLDWHLPQVDRLLDVRHGSRLDQLEAAFRALGQRIVVSLRPLDPQLTDIVTRPGRRRSIGKRPAQRRQGLRKRHADTR
jgi:antitoxin HicB